MAGEVEGVVEDVVGKREKVAEEEEREWEREVWVGWRKTEEGTVEGAVVSVI